ncbi:FxLD family lanthipeptide [Lentzea sp. NPDC102401]|uniref:FxLD family lanthipeptide n=1 Tax=Lentzea sp. NPDC102401 TaxID=3364128 RepID=UPI00382E0BDB
MSIATMPEVLEEKDFLLDLQVTEEVVIGVPVACTTNDGCPPSCASSCISNV